MESFFVRIWTTEQCEKYNDNDVDDDDDDGEAEAKWTGRRGGIQW